MNKDLTYLWEKVSKDLDVEVEIPFVFICTDTTKVEVDVLVKKFGAEKGIIIVSDYERIAPYLPEISNHGYGYSVMEACGVDEYERDSFIDVLKDWGWSGAPDDKPIWYKEEFNRRRNLTEVEIGKERTLASSGSARKFRGNLTEVEIGKERTLASNGSARGD